MMKREDVQRQTGWSLMLSLGVAIGLALFFVRDAQADNGGGWVCKAAGTVAQCPSSRTWKPCEEHRTEGVARGEDRIDAQVRAEDACADNMIRMLIVSNKDGQARIKNRCATVTCEPEPVDPRQGGKAEKQKEKAPEGHEGRIAP